MCVESFTSAASDTRGMGQTDFILFWKMRDDQKCQEADSNIDSLMFQLVNHHAGQHNS